MNAIRQTARESALSNLVAQSEIFTAWAHAAKTKGDATTHDDLRDLRSRVSTLLGAIAKIERLTPARHRSPLDPVQPNPDPTPPVALGMDRNRAKRVELGIVR